MRKIMPNRNRFTAPLRRALLVALAALALLALAVPAGAQVQVDPKLPSYKPVSGVSGSLKSIGSDTLNNLMTLWAEGFRRFYPNVQIEIEGKGSSTAPPALIGGTAQFGPMSREMKSKELDEFEKKYGYKPTALPTSIDMLAVYVHKDNPVKGLSLQQVDAIFSKTRRGGLKEDLRTWGQAGMDGAWASRPISLYGRNSASGTYGFFKENVLANGDYKDEVREQPGSSAVVQGVGSDLAGVGYSGIGYITPDVRAVPLAKNGSKFVPATPQYAYTGEYPLSRFLYIYVNHKPNAQIDPLRREFIRFIFSKEGQEVVVRDGYYPVPETVAKETRAKFGLK
jgi:phosphate transport system substrate-binding protein